MAERKVLIITYYWPPAGGAGVQRWLKFVKYLTKMGFELHIYTPTNPEAPALDESLLLDVPSNAVIIKKPIWEPFNFYKKLTSNKGNFNTGFLSEEKKNKKKWAEKLAMFIRANVFIPDAKMFWIRPSVRFLKQYVQDEKINIVVSSGPPHSLHLIALKLQMKLGIKWIADFRDPWTNIDFYKELPTLKIVDKYLHKLEKSVLQKADKVIVVGSQMKKEFSIITHPSKIEVITNGYDSKISQNPTLDKKFSILHVGSINADRNHESFYKAIRALLNEIENIKDFLQIKFVGKVDFAVRKYISMYELENFVEFVSYIPYSQISQIQASAHILYLPLNNTPNAKGILTGKFFEYLAAKRPILAQGPIDGDVAKILNETNAGFIFEFDDDNMIKEELRRQYQLFLKGETNFQSQNIEQYSRRNLTNKLAKILNDF
jgi:glycosyltransferase involved in cell wall biosynthesis